jgi:type VI secretion system protein ImpK
MSQPDDPFKPTDATTVVRPQPGAGRRPQPAAPHAAPPRQPGERPFATVPPTRPVAPAPRPAAPAPELSRAVRQVLDSGLNPLVGAASPLLMLMGQLRAMVAAPDVAAVRRHALEEVKRFEGAARAAGVSHESVLAARYALCAALDEAALSTPWGGQSEWAQQTLLVTLHREAWGGEKFFKMLDGLKADPARHIDLIELQYLCIAFGFAGKYRVREDGHSRLSEIEEELWALLRSHRAAAAEPLSIRWEGVQDRRNPLIRYVPWWVVGATALGLLAIAFAVYYARLNNAAAPVHEQLATVGLEDFTAPVAAPAAPGPTLKQLLASEEAQGHVSIEEQGGRTVITPLAPDLFASGSATLNPAYNATLATIAAAIERVPGRVLVKGHTDDQRITSLRYTDNFALSRERAAGVAKTLSTVVRSRGVTWAGVGASEPRYTPESLPQNRARNRRVEIVHVSGT